MIISASRRTDIPAFYSQWFMNRIRAGFCAVPNPFNTNQVSRVSLKPEDVDAIVFWSKNPAPILTHLDELDQCGFRYYFQFTLNNYPSALEPNIPSVDERLATFLRLAERVGPIRVIWRYDPIIISNMTPVDFHRDTFMRIASSLSGATGRVMVSLCDFYRKTDRRLAALEQQGYSFNKDAASSTEVASLLEDIAAIAGRHNMEVFTCAEELDFGNLGIRPGMCIDAGLLQKIWSISVCTTKDPTQRKHCRCVVSKDIGVNDTCMHGCRYCYSTRNNALAERRYSEHDPNSPAIWGHPAVATESAKKNYSQIRLFR
ncbi:MAG: DUF1848 domain-containing protein [Chloroflexi bacterium]|nr:DUF1848 domain-containing protein [Chloroflexota bacterium]